MNDLATSARPKSADSASSSARPCHCCGNVYRHSFEVIMRGKSYHFDSFECAVHALAPSCPRCGCRVVGHGVESESGEIFCCAHCARAEGVRGVVDNAAHS